MLHKQVPSLPPRAPQAHFAPSPCETNNLFKDFICLLLLSSLSFHFHLQQGTY